LAFDRSGEDPARRRTAGIKQRRLIRPLPDARIMRRLDGKHLLAQESLLVVEPGDLATDLVEPHARCKALACSLLTLLLQASGFRHQRRHAVLDLGPPRQRSSRLLLNGGKARLRVTQPAQHHRADRQQTRPKSLIQLHPAAAARQVAEQPPDLLAALSHRRVARQHPRHQMIEPPFDHCLLGAAVLQLGDGMGMPAVEVLDLDFHRDDTGLEAAQQRTPARQLLPHRVQAA
jgi:hypothetical protein